MPERTVALIDPEDFGRDWVTNHSAADDRTDRVAEAAYRAARAAGFAESSAVIASLAAQSAHLDKAWYELGRPLGAIWGRPE